MKATWFTRMGAAMAVIAAMVSSSCGEFVRSSNSPTQLVINQILVAAGSGTVATSFVSGPLLSDVQAATGTIFDDFGQVTLRAMLRDQGLPGGVAPSSTAVNDVTISRYRIVYSRSDGRNTPGVDVPFPIDGAMTVTIPIGGSAAGVFELVRHVAKAEAPLVVLRNNPVVIAMIADVTFFGRDQAGNEVSVSGSVQINFANFGG